MAYRRKVYLDFILIWRAEWAFATNFRIAEEKDFIWTIYFYFQGECHGYRFTKWQWEHENQLQSVARSVIAFWRIFIG